MTDMISGFRSPVDWSPGPRGKGQGGTGRGDDATADVKSKCRLKVLIFYQTVQSPFRLAMLIYLLSSFGVRRAVSSSIFQFHFPQLVQKKNPPSRMIFFFPCTHVTGAETMDGARRWCSASTHYCRFCILCRTGLHTGGYTPMVSLPDDF